jgi:hypothetical protein
MMASRRALLVSLVLVGSLVSFAAAAAIPDIAKPIVTVKGAQGCESVDAVKQLLASPGSSVTGCMPIDQNTRGYFLDERDEEPAMIELDIFVDTRQRVLWVPADELRN